MVVVQVVISVRKNSTGRLFDVALVRGAWGAVERKECLFILLEVMSLHMLRPYIMNIYHVFIYYDHMRFIHYDHILRPT